MQRILIRIIVCILFSGIAVADLVSAEVADVWSHPLQTDFRLTQDFSEWNEVFWAFHLGEDYTTCTPGIETVQLSDCAEDPVYASGDGIIRHVAKHVGYGYTVIVEHQLPPNDPTAPAVMSLYGHLRKEGLITERDEAGNPKKVSLGDIIGFLSREKDENGGCDFVHLHFGIRKGPFFPFLLGNNPISNCWYYAGYSSLFTTICMDEPNRIKDRNNPNHSLILSEWTDPSNFIQEHQPIPTITRAYVTNYGSYPSVGNSVSVIDTATNSVIATVPVGEWPIGVAAHPDGTRVYVTNRIIGGTVAVIDTVTNSVIATVPVGASPYGVAVHPDGTRVYVTNNISGTLSVIDTATNSVIATVPVGGSPIGVAVHPDGTRVFVTSSNDVLVIDTATNSVIDTVPVGYNPHGIAVHPNGTRVYVANLFDGTVSVIDTATNSVIATVPVGDQPYGVAVHPAGTRVYVTNNISGTLSVIDTITNSVIATVPVGTYFDPYGVSVHPDGTRVFVANNTSGTVAVIDTATDSVIDNIPVGVGPIAFGQFIGQVSLAE